MYVLHRMKNSTASLFGAGNYATLNNKEKNPSRHKFVFCLLGSVSIVVLALVLIVTWIGITYTSLTLYARISPCVGEQRANTKTNATPAGAAADGPAADAASLSWSQNRTVVWIQARWRTGSSVIAEALAQNPKVMYLFEPEHIIESLMVDGVISSDDQYQQWLEDFMVDLIQCRMHSRWFIWFMPQYAPTKWPHAVMPQHDTMLQLAFSDKYFPNISQRIQAFESYCRARPFVLLKTVRLTLQTTSRVIQRLPHANFRDNIKLITLWRDPRAVASSVFKIPRDIIRPKTKPYAYWLVEYCADVASEYQYFTDEFRLSSSTLLPSRYELLFYEDFMQAPTENLEKLSTFSGIPRTPKFDEYSRTHFFVGSQKPNSLENQSFANNNTSEASERDAAALPDDDVHVSFSTVRSRLFDPQHWKKDAPPLLLKALRTAPACQQAISLFTQLYEKKNSFEPRS